MKCWSKSRARTPCRSSPKICVELRPETNEYSKLPTPRTLRNSAWRERLHLHRQGAIHQAEELPELDDQFATQLGEFKTLDEVRQRIREGMEAERKHTAEHEAKDKLVAELVKRSEFEVPEALVDRQVDVRLERGLRALAAQGMKAEDIKKMDLNRLRVGQRDQALQEVKASLLLDKIAEEEKIEVSDAEIDREIEALGHPVKTDAGGDPRPFDT